VSISLSLGIGELVETEDTDATCLKEEAVLSWTLGHRPRLSIFYRKRANVTGISYPIGGNWYWNENGENNTDAGYNTILHPKCMDMQ